MMEFWQDLAFSVMFTLLRGLVKNPQKAAELRRAFAKLHTNIHLVYPDIEE